jgi:hypothetical protein
MQAIEMETTIDKNGMVHALRMPAAYQRWYGSQAKLIILLPDIFSDDKLLEENVSSPETIELLAAVQQNSSRSSLPSARPVDIMQYAGKIHWPMDGLAYQYEVREEWKR